MTGALIVIEATPNASDVRSVSWTTRSRSIGSASGVIRTASSLRSRAAFDCRDCIGSERSLADGVLGNSAGEADTSTKSLPTEN